MTGDQIKTEGAPLAFDIGDADFRRDPYPRYAELQEAEVLHRTRDGAWMLTRHADVLAAVRDARLSSNPAHIARAPNDPREAGLPFLGEMGIQLLLTADPPDHTRLRRLANRAFTVRAVERLRPRVAQLVDEMLDDMAASDQPDIMHHLAEPLPVFVICEMLGVPIEDRERFKPWSDHVARIIDADADESTLQEALPSVMGFVQYFADLIEKRRAEPGDDLLSALVAAEEDGDSLTLQELHAMLILLFVAGHETTTNLLGNGTFALLRDPAQFALLRDDPTLATSATEELLRFDSPVQMTGRTAMEDVELNGIPIAKGHTVVCSLAGANRDPRFVDDPEALRIDREPAMHVSFSNGMHHCLGAPLARLEGQVAFAALAQRFPDLSLVTDRPPYRDHFILRGLSSLPVQLG